MGSSRPQTPTSPLSHRRHPSSLDFSHSTPNRRYSSGRRPSSTYSPITPRSTGGFAAQNDTSELDSSTLDAGGGDGGLGSLADELADAWSDDEYGEAEEGVSELLPSFGEPIQVNGYTNGHGGALPRDSGVADVQSSPSQPQNGFLSPSHSPSKSTRNGGRQQHQSLYDGSDYGEESDLESGDLIGDGLEARMAAIEALARRGSESNGSQMDDVIGRVTESLRDLGAQTGIEGGATRYVSNFSNLFNSLPVSLPSHRQTGRASHIG